MASHDSRTVMRWQSRRFLPAVVPVVVGLAWLAVGASAGLAACVLTVAPGVVLVAAGGAQLLWPGDRQILYHLALGALASALLALLLWPVLGLIAGPALVAGGWLSFHVAGLAAVWQHPLPHDVERPATDVRLMRRVALDDALLGFFINCARIPKGEAAARDIDEIAALSAFVATRGWPAGAATWHAAPEAPREFTLERARAAGQDFEWLTFDSGFVPESALPGAARWQAHAANRGMAARVLRHPDGAAGRPWLVCIHGYRMGVPVMDWPLFDAAHLHGRHGCNLICPILPLHGVRRVAKLTGGLFLDGPLVDLLHAQTQAVWDIRRCIAWVRATQPDARIGALGFSLGGYNAALTAATEPDLACVIAGIPLADIPGVLWHHMPLAHRAYLESHDVSAATIGELLAPVSPLHRPVRVPVDRRFIFAATADQIVPPDQAVRLWHHWQQPAIHWYHGSHVSVRSQPTIRPFIDRALAAGGLVATHAETA